MAYDYVPPKVIETPLELICDNQWHELDFPKFTGKATEKQDTHVYINVESGFDVGTVDAPIEIGCPNCGSKFNGNVKIPGTGRLRIKMQREPFAGQPADDTYFYDLFLHNGLGHIDSRALFEMAEKNRITHWEYRVTGATKVTLSTRFVKNSIELGQVDL